MVRLGYKEPWVDAVVAGRISAGTILVRALRVVRDDIVRAMFLARKKSRSLNGRLLRGVLTVA